MFSFNTFVYEWQSTLPINFNHYSQYLKIVCKSHCDNSTKSRILCTYFSSLDIATDVYGPCSKTNFSWKTTNAFCHRMLKCCSMVNFQSWKTKIEAFFGNYRSKSYRKTKKHCFDQNLFDLGPWSKAYFQFLANCSWSWRYTHIQTSRHVIQEVLNMILPISEE